MQNVISIWASKNIFLARLFLIILHTLLGGIAYVIALNVASSINVSPWLTFTPLLLSVLLLISYDKRKNNKKVSTSLIGLRMLFWFFVGIQLYNFAIPATSTVNYARFTTYSIDDVKADNVEKQKLTLKQRIIAQLKKNIKRDLNFFKIKKDNSLQIVLLILGTIALISVLTSLILLLACSIACNGSEALAILVLLLGLFGIGAIVAAAIRTVQRLQDEDDKKRPLKSDDEELDKLLYRDNPNARPSTPKPNTADDSELDKLLNRDAPKNPNTTSPPKSPTNDNDLDKLLNRDNKNVAPPPTPKKNDDSMQSPGYAAKASPNPSKTVPITPKPKKKTSRQLKEEQKLEVKRHMIKVFVIATLVLLFVGALAL
jgi:hypothetical protein